MTDITPTTKRRFRTFKTDFPAGADAAAGQAGAKKLQDEKVVEFSSVTNERSEKLFVSERLKLFILTGQPDNGTYSGLAIKPFHQLGKDELAALKAKAEPHGDNSKITIEKRSNELFFTDDMTGKTARVPFHHLNADVREKLSDPFKRIAFHDAAKIALRRKLAVGVLGLAGLGGGLGTAYNAGVFEPLSEPLSDITTRVFAPEAKPVAAPPVELTGVREKNALKFEENPANVEYLGKQMDSFPPAESKFLYTVMVGEAQRAAGRLAQKDGAEVLKHTGALAVIIAVRNGDLDMIRVLHGAGQSVNQAYHPTTYAPEDVWVPLVDAVERGLPKTVELLIALGADTEQRDNPRRPTPYMLAAYSPLVETAAAIEVMDKLQKGGAKVQAISPYGEDALMHAVTGSFGEAQKFEKALSVLPDARAAMNHVYRTHKGGLTVLMAEIDRLSYKGDANNAIVKSMLDHGADVKVKNADGWTALHMAAELDQLETVKLLVKQGANIHARTNDGQTALDIAKKSDFEPAATIRYLQSLMAAKPKAPVPAV